MDYSTLEPEADSTCSTPSASAPSSPPPHPCFFSAPASPTHCLPPPTTASIIPPAPSSSDFEFTPRFPPFFDITPNPTSMISADELFLNGQIRPTSTPLPQNLVAPRSRPENNASTENLAAPSSPQRGRDLARSRSPHRRTRSMSPLRAHEPENPPEDSPSPAVPPENPSNPGRSSRRWISFKDLLYRSKSEGRSSSKEKIWLSLTFSPSKEKKSNPKGQVQGPEKSTEKLQASEKLAEKGHIPARKSNMGKRRVPPSPHEVHYTANRAVAEEMRKKTFLPYRHGLFGCLGFSSRSYGAVNGLARSLHPVSSR
ncbi:hypothetical protein AMTRI_Chr02g263930 [Amborella trichopoda]